MINKRGQVVFEFIVTLGGVMLLFLLTSSFIKGQIYDYNVEFQTTELNNLGRGLQQRVFAVSNSHAGLEVKYKLPQKINNMNYDIYLLNNYLYIEQGEYQKIYALPPLTGTISNLTISIYNNGTEVLIS